MRFLQIPAWHIFCFIRILLLRFADRKRPFLVLCFSILQILTIGLSLDTHHVMPLVTTRPIEYLHQTSSVLRSTRHNSVDSVPTSNLVCIKKVAIRTTFSHMINIFGINYYTCSLVIDIQCTRYKNIFKKLSNHFPNKPWYFRV